MKIINFGIAFLSQDYENWARLHVTPITKRGRVKLALIYVDSVMANNIVLEELIRSANL